MENCLFLHIIKLNQLIYYGINRQSGRRMYLQFTYNITTMSNNGMDRQMQFLC